MHSFSVRRWPFTALFKISLMSDLLIKSCTWLLFFNASIVSAVDTFISYKWAYLVKRNSTIWQKYLLRYQNWLRSYNHCRLPLILILALWLIGFSSFTLGNESLRIIGVIRGIVYNTNFISANQQYIAKANNCYRHAQEAQR